MALREGQMGLDFALALFQQRFGIPPSLCPPARALAQASLTVLKECCSSRSTRPIMERRPMGA